MTRRRTLRVRARRNAGGCVLEWHPSDTDARTILDGHHRIIKQLYSVVDRRLVSDGDVVATVEVWPSSGELESIDVEDSVVRERAAMLDVGELQSAGGVEA